MSSAEILTDEEPLLKGVAEQKRLHNGYPLWRYVFILPVLFFTILGTQLTLFVLTEWTQHKITVDNFAGLNTSGRQSNCKSENTSDPAYQKYQEVQQKSAHWMMFYSFAEMLPNMLALFILPSLTDTYGRKFLLYITMAGMCVKGLVIILTIRYDASLLFILIGSVVNGLSGNLFATFSAAFALVADITVPGKQRTFRLVLTEFMIFIGNVLGSYLSGYLIGKDNVGFLYTSVIAMSFSGAALLFVIVVPESLSKDKRSKPQPIFQSIKRMTDFYISREHKGKRLAYILLLLTAVFAFFGSMGRNGVETLYFLGKPFCWDSNEIGIYTMVRSALQGFIGLGSLKLLQKFLSNPSIAVLSIISSMASFFMEAFASSTLMIYMVSVAGMFSLLVNPLIQSLLSNMTPANRQGSLFAGLSAVMVTTTLISSLSVNAIYSATLSIMNGFVFLILGMVTIIDVMIMVIFICTKKDKLSQTPEDPDIDTGDKIAGI